MLGVTRVESLALATALVSTYFLWLSFLQCLDAMALSADGLQVSLNVAAIGKERLDMIDFKGVVQLLLTQATAPPLLPCDS